jgi:hypothetical protein
MAGGVLGRLDLRPPEDLDTGKTRLMGPPADAMKYIQSQGLTLAGAPRSGYRGEMPSTITSLDDEELGDILNNLSAWCAFIESELAKASIQQDAAKAHLDFTKARVRIALKADEDGKKLTSQDKNDRVETDPRVVEAKSSDLYASSLYILTRTMRDKAQRDWETVSRRITQRGQEVQRIGRETNVAGIPMQTGRSFVRRG